MTEPYEKAPGWRVIGAGLIDSAVLWPFARRIGGLRVPLNAIVEVLREQVGSPGQRLLGVRTVDRRTGQRVALPRSLALAAVAAAGALLTHRRSPRALHPRPQRAVEDYWRALREIDARHADDPEAAAAERLQLQPPPLGFEIRIALVPMLGTVLVTAILRRRLAPTVQALRRG